MSEYARPPRFAEWMLAKLFPDQGSYSTLGDLAEVYNYLIEEEGRFRAQTWYWLQALRAIGPFLLNKVYWGGLMFKNYVVIALRNLKRQKVYTAINVFGLALAIACVVLIYHFVRSETTYDTFHEDVDEIYRVTSVVQFRDLERWDSTPYPLAAAIEEQASGVESVVRFISMPDRVVRIGEEVVHTKAHLAGLSFFEIFNFSLEYGHPRVLQDDPSAVIISQRFRDTYFGGYSALGSHLAIDLRGDGEYTDFVVQGVAEPFPENSSIQFDLLLSEGVYKNIVPERALSNWFPKTQISTFLKASSGVTKEALQSNIEQIAVSQGLREMWRIQDAEYVMPLQTLRDIHLSRDVKNVLLEPSGDISYSYILGIVSALVLLIACINFVNLSVGLSTNRIKEVGMRKVMGAQRGQVMRQFWFESLVMSFLALFLGLALAHLFLPTFNALSGKALVLNYYTNGTTLVVLLGLTLGVGLISGIYPAIVVSRFKPAIVLKGSLKLGGKNVFARSMVALQFTLSIFLIACTLIMASQLRHISEHNLGFDSELLVYQRLTKPADDALVARYRQAALLHPNVVGVTATRATLTGDAPGSIWAVSFEGERMTVPVHKVDYDFLEVMGIELVAGRNLSRDHPGDLTGGVLVNEAFVDAFNMNDAVGERVPFGGEQDPVIVGVVHGFHFQSLRKEIEPLVLYLRPDSDFREVVVRIQGDQLSTTLAALQDTWGGLGTGTMFEYTFFDEVVQSQYETDFHFRTISAYTSYFAILIACMGLFGITSLSVARRTKEMGIRKVLGASSTRILMLFNREYIYLFLIANLAAWPLVYYFMSEWLEQFAYRVEIGVGSLALAGGLVVALAMLTITSQAFKTTQINPAHSVRHE